MVRFGSPLYQFPDRALSEPQVLVFAIALASRRLLSRMRISAPSIDGFLSSRTATVSFAKMFRPLSPPLLPFGLRCTA